MNKEESEYAVVSFEIVGSNPSDLSKAFSFVNDQGWDVHQDRNAEGVYLGLYLRNDQFIALVKAMGDILHD